MKRFGLWLTMAAMFSLPVLVFVNASGGSPDATKGNGAVKVNKTHPTHKPHKPRNTDRKRRK
jgi:hypothetical protein